MVLKSKVGSKSFPGLPSAETSPAAAVGPLCRANFQVTSVYGVLLTQACDGSCAGSRGGAGRGKHTSHIAAPHPGSSATQRGPGGAAKLTPLPLEISFSNYIFTQVIMSNTIYVSCCWLIFNLQNTSLQKEGAGGWVCCCI